MHESLMMVPNELFYSNRIRCGYVPNEQKKFMLSDSPFLFIDVPSGVEKLKGTSFYNMEEVSVIEELKTICLNAFKKISGCKFTKNSMYVITPYNAQRNAIAECFSEDQTDD